MPNCIVSCARHKSFFQLIACNPFWVNNSNNNNHWKQFVRSNGLHHTQNTAPKTTPNITV